MEIQDLTGFTILLILAISCIIPKIKIQQKRKRYITRAVIIGCAILLYSIVVIISLRPIRANGTTTVYITNTGRKYHTSDCAHLYRSRYDIALAEAIQKGYDDCMNCDPPTYIPQTIRPVFSDLYDLENIKVVAVFILLLAGYVFLLFILPYILWNRWKKKRGKR